MKQSFFQTISRSESADVESCRMLYENCRQWLESEGDVDDFIFYQSEHSVSER